MKRHFFRFSHGTFEKTAEITALYCFCKIYSYTYAVRAHLSFYIIWCMKFSALGMISVGQSFRRRYSDRCPRALCKSDQERVQILNKYIVNGGRPLYGEVTISGAKNAVLPILAACLLTEEVCEIQNVPPLADVRHMAELLTELGARVEYDAAAETMRVQAAELTHVEGAYETARKMRASFLAAGRYWQDAVRQGCPCPAGVRLEAGRLTCT